jgi:hypothetical protein
MTCNAHPTLMIAVAEQRHAEFRAEADRHRLANLGQDDADRRRPWVDLLTVAAVALAMLLAADVAPAQDGSPQTPHELEPATIAVQHAREAAP